jgi:hypothetical protein
MRDDGIATDVPLNGLLFGFVEAFGQPRDAALRCFLLHDAAANRLGTDLYAETGLRIPLYDAEFRRQRRAFVIDLQTLIQSGVASFILGARDLAEYDAFKEELRNMGADRLLGLYRERCALADPQVLEREMKP